MNEKIEKFAEQAYTIWREYDEIDANYQDSFEQVFARLIVQECIDQIEIERGNPYRNMEDINEYGISACNQSILRIKQHFGVE